MVSVTVRPVVEVVLVAIASLALLATLVVGGLAASSDAEKYGFKNGTAQISDKYFTQITPADFTFAIWGVVYIWQILWIVYAWSFVCRQLVQQTIFPGVYVGFTLTCLLNITWLYVWGNEKVASAAVVLFAFNVVIYVTIAMLAGYFFQLKNIDKVDASLTRFLPLNGLAFYATWTTIASLVNLCAALQYSADVDASDAGTISLSLLTVVVLVYFALENTVLDHFARYVFAVYPVVIWALAGVLATQWDREGQDRNNIFTLVLLIVVVVLALVRVASFVLFTFFCPLQSPYKKLTTSQTV